VKIAGYETHPAADLFPLLDGQELRDLADDIKANGLLNPVVLYTLGGERLVLDGRNRLRACEIAGVAPSFEFWNGEGSPTAWVVSQNLKRRHLNESQRAMVAKGIRDLLKSEGANLHSDTADQAAAMLNVSRRSIFHAEAVTERGAPELADAVRQGHVAVSTAAVLASDPPEKQREVVARGEVEILRRAKEIRAAKLEERRAERVEKLAEIAKGNAPLPAGQSAERYPVIYADPPWRYEHAESSTREIENHYPTMDLDAICAMEVCKISTPDAILFLWATSPKLAEAMRVIESWGFTYRTCAVWVKDKIGMGYYYRQRHELLLVATRGSMPVPAPADRPDSVIDGPIGAHSAKPSLAAEQIERMYPGLPRLELFCRSPRPGWSVWGNQAA
jgi:N6-adenosine-specific RNA methylase IME4